MARWSWRRRTPRRGVPIASQLPFRAQHVELKPSNSWPLASVTTRWSSSGTRSPVVRRPAPVGPDQAITHLATELGVGRSPLVGVVQREPLAAFTRNVRSLLSVKAARSVGIPAADVGVEGRRVGVWTSAPRTKHSSRCLWLTEDPSLERLGREV